MKKIVTIVVLGLLGVLLTGCLNVVEDQDKQGKTVDIVQTVTIAGSRKDENAKIETVTETVPVNPKRVALFDYGVLDILNEVGIDNLGIEKLSVVKSNLPAYLSAYNDKKYGVAGISLFEPNYDELDLFNADLIILSDRSAWAYDSLKKELNGVSVLTLSIDNTDYLASVKNNLSVLSKVFDGHQAFNVLSETLTIKTNELAAKAKNINLNALILMTNGNSISGYGIGSRFGFIHNELSFTAADLNFGRGDENAHGDQISFEYISVLNPDIIFVVDRTAATSSDTSYEILNVSLVNETNAGKSGRIIILDSVIWYLASGGYQSTLKMIEDTAKVFNV
ncbi:MAG TPA: ABC transporter substrate-binding protein [Acholeplasma sp.]|nr:ABC transporter substrate-binding protein [Acholeplasma sp.]